MKNLMQIAAGLDVLPLALALKQHPELWNQNTERTTRYRTAHSEASDIWVRFRAREELTCDLDYNQEHDSVWYPAYYALPQLRPLIFWLMNRVQGERLGGVLITRIPPGGQIYPHADDGWHARYYQKYAIQIEATPEQSFNFDGESMRAVPGDVYWFNNLERHWVLNESEFDRTTLIVCIKG